MHCFWYTLNVIIFQFLRDIIISIFSVAAVFTLPGYLVLHYFKIKASSGEKLIVSTSLGFIVMTFIWYILSWLKIRFFMPIILVFSIYLFLKLFKQITQEKDREGIFSKLSVILLVLFSLVFLIPYYASGEFGTFISLVGVHYQDSPLHISMINELARIFPPEDPGFSGNALRGYHFFYNLSSSMLVWLFNIPSEVIHFRTMPMLFAFMWAFLSYIFAKRLFRSVYVALLSVFFLMFGASFSPIISWIYHVPISYNSGMGILQPAGSLLNPPFASSVVVLLTGLYVLLRLEQTKNYLLFFLLPIIFGTAIEYKVYAGIAGLAVFGIYLLLRLRRFTWKSIIAGIFTLIIAFLVYWPFTGSAGYLVYAPLWVTHEIARAALPFLRYDNAISEYTRLFDPIRILLLECKLILFYVVGNLGIRIIGLLGFIRIKTLRGDEKFFSLLFLVMFAVSFLIPLLFMQSIKPYEISQLFNYSLIALAFPTAALIGKLTEKSKVRIFSFFFLFIPIMFSLPELVRADYPQYMVSPIKTIPIDEISILRSIKNTHEKKTILFLPEGSLPFDRYNDWFRYKTDLIIPAFSGYRAFLAFTNIWYQEDEVTRRLTIIRQIIDENNALQKGNTLHEKIILRDLSIKYDITNIVAPNRLLGYEKAGRITKIGESNGNVFYSINK